MGITPERQLVEIVRGAVAPVPFYWGWAPLQSAEMPPPLPLVTMARTVADCGPWEDMCTAADIPAHVSIALHVWATEYEAARDLQGLVRATINGQADGWALQTEIDQYDPVMRAWEIISDWQARGLVLE